MISGATTASSRPIAIGPSRNRNAVHHQAAASPLRRRISTASAAASSTVIMSDHTMAYPAP